MASNLRRIVIISCFVFALHQLIQFLFTWHTGHNISSLCRWDCVWYSSIVDHSYDLAPHAHPKGDAANWAFFPAFPMATTFVKLLFPFISTPVALVICSKLFFLLSIAAFLWCGLLYSPRVSPILLAVIVALNPYSIYGNVGYTEPMFLFFSSLFFISLKNRNYIMSGFFSGILTSVRFVGFPAAFILSFKYLVALLNKTKTDRIALYIGAIISPLGLVLFAYYLYYHVGDALAFAHIQVAWGKAVNNPAVVVFSGLKGGPFNIVAALLSLYAFCGVFYYSARKEYAILFFLLVGIILPLISTLASMPRYISWQVPILLFTGELLTALKIPIVLLVGFFVIGLYFMYHSWLNGAGFVI